MKVAYHPKHNKIYLLTAVPMTSAGIYVLAEDIEDKSFFICTQQEWETISQYIIGEL